MLESTINVWQCGHTKGCSQNRRVIIKYFPDTWLAKVYCFYARGEGGRPGGLIPPTCSIGLIFSDVVRAMSTALYAHVTGAWDSVHVLYPFHQNYSHYLFQQYCKPCAHQLSNQSKRTLMVTLHVAGVYAHYLCIVPSPHAGSPMYVGGHAVTNTYLWLSI